MIGETMPDVQLQLHAMPSETLDIVLGAMRDLHVNCVYFNDATGSFTPIGSEEHLRLVWPVRQIIFTSATPQTECSTLMQFLKCNPGSLVIDVGVLNSTSLGETYIRSRCDVQESLATWKKFVAKVRRNTGTGAWGLWPDGRRVSLNRQRFTTGALHAESSGITMHPLTGDFKIVLDSSGG